MKFVFEKPYTFEGKEYSEVILDLDGMKAEDTEAAAEQAELMVGQNKSFARGQASFLVCVMAKASKLPVEFFKGLPAREYLRLKGQVNAFLFL